MLLKKIEAKSFPDPPGRTFPAQLWKQFLILLMGNKQKTAVRGQERTQ
jgi:hypothetical protein